MWMDEGGKGREERKVSWEKKRIWEGGKGVDVKGREEMRV